MQSVRRVVWLLLILAMVASCSRTRTEQESAAVQEGVEIRGFVRHVDLEGGFYGIVADDGTRYEPVNLPEEFRQEGIRVKVRGTVEKGKGSIRMWGELLNISDIKKVQHH